MPRVWPVPWCARKGLISSVRYLCGCVFHFRWGKSKRTILLVKDNIHKTRFFLYIILFKVVLVFQSKLPIILVGDTPNIWINASTKKHDFIHFCSMTRYDEGVTITFGIPCIVSKETRYHIKFCFVGECILRTLLQLCTSASPEVLTAELKLLGLWA